MFGIIMSLIAGLSMSLQGVFNTRLSEKIGLLETTFLVQGIGLIITIFAMVIFGNGNIKNIKNANKLYLLGGVLAVVITYSVMIGIKRLGPTIAISTILVAQLAFAGIIDAFGLFETPKIPFGITKIIGIIVMIGGILIFKWKH